MSVESYKEWLRVTNGALRKKMDAKKDKKGKKNDFVDHEYAKANGIYAVLSHLKTERGSKKSESVRIFFFFFLN
jgi:hypothetical protein